MLSGRAVGHGTALRVQPLAAAASRIAPTSVNMSVSSTGTSSGRRSGAGADSVSNGTMRTSTSASTAARSRRRPATRAVWNSIRSRPWKRAYARPTKRSGMVAAMPELSTALECAGLPTRKQMRSPALASICAGRAPSKFCVTSSRLIPRARPMRVIDSSSFNCSRPPSLASSSPNSSTTTSRRGSAGRSGRLRRAKRYESRLLDPAEASRSWRRRDSALSMTIVRRNCSMSRLVETSTTWGIGRTASWSTPPLKSTITIDRSSGWLFRQSETSSVFRNSVLPEPDVPPTRPCGPSRTRSTTIGTSDAVPTTTDVFGEIVVHRLTRSSPDTGDGTSSSRSTRCTVPPSAVCSSWSIGRRAASRRALCSARSAGISGTITSSVRGWWRLWKTAVSAASVTVRRAPAPSGASRGSIVRPTTPRGGPLASRSASSPGAIRSVPSTTTRWIGSGRSTSSSARVSMSCLIDLIAAAQPSPSVVMLQPWSPLNVCGSQRANPHSAPVWSRVSTQMRSSVGECVAASESTRPRAAACARPCGPTRASDPVASRLVSSGVPHCSVSSSSSGSTAWIDDASGASPTHTEVKSSSVGLRSHRRRWRASACSAATPAHAAEWRRRERSSRRKATTLARNWASSAAYSSAFS